MSNHHSAPEYFQNIATGNANVGFQVGKNSGTITANTSGLDRLAAALHDAHQRGDIDSETHAEAEHEVDTARRAIAESNPGRAARALRRLTAMTDGIAGFGVLVGTVLEGLGS